MYSEIDLIFSETFHMKSGSEQGERDKRKCMRYLPSKRNDSTYVNQTDGKSSLSILELVSRIL